MVDVDGGPVLPHVQAFADAVNENTGITHIMTYAGHEPTQNRALDTFATHEQGDVVAQFAIDNYDHFGVLYIIWRQRIYNPSVGRAYWRDMEDRGSITQNHYDHVHVSFQPTGPAVPGTTTTSEEDDMFIDDDRTVLHLVKDAVARSDANDESTNKAVGRLEIAIRDPLAGLTKAVEALGEKIDALRK